MAARDSGEVEVMDLAAWRILFRTAFSRSEGKECVWRGLPTRVSLVATYVWVCKLGLTVGVVHREHVWTLEAAFHFSPSRFPVGGKVDLSWPRLGSRSPRLTEVTRGEVGHRLHE